ncbi:MAG TPA: hypothetical protein VGI40_05050 [Pirellulaceae bacterium]|jgi:hypothetical protein
MPDNPFTENPYAAPQADVIPAELVERPGPKRRPRSPVLAGMLLLLSLPLAAFMARMWITFFSRWSAGDTELIVTAPTGAIPMVAIVSLLIFGGIPVCLHEIIQAIRGR